MICRCRSFWSVLSAVILVLGALPVAPPAAAQQVKRAVTSTADTNECNQLTCTLRGALVSGADIVEFAVGGAIKLNGPLMLRSVLNVKQNVTIKVPNGMSVTVDGQNSHRIFLVDRDHRVTIENVTLQGGKASSNDDDGPGTAGKGGAINAQTDSVVRLRNSTVKDSAAVEGGAIYNDGGSVELSNSTLSGNTARNSGGAIYNNRTGTVEVKDVSKLLDNSTTHEAPGLGGGIMNAGGTVNVVDSLLERNKAPKGGGAIANVGGGELTLTNSTISNSTAQDGGAITSAAGTVTIDASTLSDNTATRRGGAIDNIATLTMTNSTVSRNSAGTNGGGLLNGDPGTATLTHVTMKNNSAGGSGGGIRGTAVVLRNSIVIASTGGNCSTSLQTVKNSLSDTNECFEGGSNGNLVSTDPKVGPLAVNEPGTTATHALLLGSPAIDGVTFNSTDCGTTVTRDQRGLARPQRQVANRCDIGAFELDANDPPTISAIDNRTTNEDTQTPVIPFTIDDSQTAGASLTVSGTSSNQTLVPTANITLAGAGKSRTVRITPAANRSGAADITLTVSDGIAQASTTFRLTVTAVNDAPVTTVPPAQSTAVDIPLVFSTAKGNAISVADVDATNLRLTMTATGGTVTLNGTGGLTINDGANGAAFIMITGSKGNLNNALNGLTFTPALHSTAAGRVEIGTSDLGATGDGGQKTDTDKIDISINAAVNSPPTISPIADQTTGAGTPTSAIPFTVGDAETAPGSLVVTATSNAPTLVPNTPGAITLDGSGPSRTILVTPAPNQTGTATIDVAVSDGSLTTHETFTLTVRAANDLMVAANDAYTVAAGETLTVAAGTGVLANDGNAGAGSVEARVVAVPAHGTLNLKPDGSFTYATRGDYAGPDSFTYRVTRGGSTSEVATVTIAITPTACAPRATVKVTTNAVGGKLQVALEAVPLATQAPNRLTELRFGTFQNARVTLNGQPVAGGTVIAVPGNATTATFTVERASPGQPTTVPFTAVDVCGAWPSLVGGGPGAGF